MRGNISGAMPMPVSRTLTSIVEPIRRAASVIVPPSGVNLAALLSRLASACDRRVRSA